jgi:hypothetical protein
MKLSESQSLSISLDGPAGPKGVHVSVFCTDGKSAFALLQKESDCEVFRGEERTVETINIHNADEGSCIVAVSKASEEGSTCTKRTLLGGETFAYDCGGGWQILSPHRGIRKAG